MAYSTDLDSSDSEEADDDEGIPDWLPAGLPNVSRPESDRVWFDDNGNPIGNAQDDNGDWSTDEGEQDVPMTDAVPTNDCETPRESDSVLSYQSILAHTPSGSQTEASLEKFKILEGEPPADHHFKGYGSTHFDGQHLRRIQKEHKILRSSLPPEVLVRYVIPRSSCVCLMQYCVIRLLTQ